jgi:TusA-related sulfurtransferase
MEDTLENLGGILELTTDDVKKSLESGGLGIGDIDVYKSPIDEDFSSLVKDEYGFEINEEFFGDEKPSDKKEAYKKVISALKSQSKDSNFGDDPFINEYITAKKEQDFNVQDFITSKIAKKNIEEMSSEDYLKIKLKSQNYTDEDIDSFIRTKNKIELDQISKSFKIEDQKNVDLVVRQKNTEYIGKLEKENDLKNSEIKNTITKYINDNLKMKFPIKFDEVEMKEINQEAINLLKVNIGKTKNGEIRNYQEIDNVLNDDNVMLQVLPFIILAKNGKLDAKLRDYISSVKSLEFDKIIDVDDIGAGGGRTSGDIVKQFFGH